MNTIPTLETDRLILRAHSLKDFDDSFKMWSNPKVVEFISGKPSTEQQSWSRVMTYLGHWQLLGFGYWAVIEKSTGEFVGEIGFADFKRDINPSIKDTPELGWALTPSMHGKGYATECLKKAIEWGDNHFRKARTVCIINPNNIASLNVAKKCGYTEWTKTTFNNEPVIIYERKL